MELEAVEQSQAVFMSEALGCPWVTPCKRIGHPTERDPLELRSTRAGFGCVLDCVIERESSSQGLGCLIGPPSTGGAARTTCNLF